MFIAALVCILFVMFLGLLRAFAGPTLYDRILAANLFGTKTVLFIAIVGFISDRSYFLDIAIIYALLNFISVIGVLRFFEHQESQKANADANVEANKESQ